MRIHNLSVRGSKIAGYQIKALRMISVTVMVKAGAWYENENQSGYFHLLEHLMMTGTDKFGSLKKLTDYKEEYGISFGATTSRDRMDFWFDFPDIYLKESLELIGELLFHSNINFENIKNEISIIEQEYNGCWNNPYKKFDATVEKRMAGKNCNLINEVLGEPQNIRRATRNDLKEIYKRYFQPQNMCWGIAGNFDWKETVKLFREVIPKPIYKKRIVDITVKNWSPSFGKVIFKNKINQPYVRIIWQMPSSDKFSMTKKFGINLFNQMLGYGSSSQIVTRIRQELGLAYSVGSGCWTWPNCSFLDIDVSTDTKKVDLVISEIERVVNEFLFKEIEQEKFKKALRYIDLSTLMSFSSLTKISGRLARFLFYDKKVYTPKQTIALAHKMNIVKIQKWFRENIKKEKQIVAIMTAEN
jgi:predicted Zn-dependent peptidase